jgi:hypothetical protein
MQLIAEVYRRVETLDDVKDASKKDKEEEELQFLKDFRAWLYDKERTSEDLITLKRKMTQ